MNCGFPERHGATGIRLRRSRRIADCAKRTQFQAASGTPPAPLGPPASPLGQRQLYKQSQFPAEQKEGQSLGWKGVMVNSTFDGPRQNKAKLGQDGTSNKPNFRRGRWGQGLGHEGLLCETNPISAVARGTWHGHPARESGPSAGCRCHCTTCRRHYRPVGDPAAIVPNKPNSRRWRMGQGLRAWT
jgi:hypothetical protein